MFSFLKNHPFAVEAYFNYSLTLVFAVPKENLQHLIPQCLSLDTYLDKWAFVAVALVQTRSLRPKGFPAFMGNDFFLMGYRVFVRYKNNNGRNLRGLYILKSETDSKIMQLGGNIFTHYHFSTIDIKLSDEGDFKKISSAKSGVHFKYSEGKKNVELPEASPFKDWHEARKFSGPLPFTFTLNKAKTKVLIVEGVRENWIPIPVGISEYSVSFFEQMNIQGALLANAFIIKNIPYYWKKGKQELWKP
jgi:hypothetical protein